MGIRERLSKFLEKSNPESKIVKSYSMQGDAPKVSFKQLMEYYEKTPQVSIGVTGYSELITGTDLQINADDEEAKKFIEEWNRKTNFYDKLENMVTTFLVCGNSILEKLDDKLIEDVAEVDMSTITGKKRDDYGNTEFYYQNVGGQNTPLGQGNLNKFIEFNLSMYSRKEWSPSLFQSIAEARTVGNRTTLPIIEMLWAIEDAMGAVFVNHAYPLEYFTFEGANADELEKEAQKIKKFKPGDKFIGTKKPEVSIFETQAQSKYPDYINHYNRLTQLGIKFPHDIMTGDFTSRASSETTDDLTTKIARGIQRYICNKLKIELYDLILKQNGYDPMKANLSVSFTTQNIIKLNPDQVKERVMSGMWTKEEGREWDKDNLGADLFDDNKINDDEEEPEKTEEKCQLCNESQHALCIGCGCKH